MSTCYVRKNGDGGERWERGKDEEIRDVFEKRDYERMFHSYICFDEWT